MRFPPRSHDAHREEQATFNAETNDAGENGVQTRAQGTAKEKKQRRERRGETERRRRNAALRTSWEHRGSRDDDHGNVLRVGRFRIRQGSWM